jgi:hypothetical protein
MAAIPKAIAAAAAQVNATIDAQSFDNGALVVDAPAGFVWSSNGGHAMREDFDLGRGQRWLRAATREMLERIAGGLRRCDDADCDVCEDAR